MTKLNLRKSSVTKTNLAKTKKIFLFSSVFLLASFLIASSAFATRYTNESYFIYGKENLKFFTPHNELTIDHVSQYGFEVYGPRGLGSYIQRVGARSAVLKSQPLRGPKYASHEEVTLRLKSVAAKYPQLVNLMSIGKSVRGKDLWVVKVSRNVQVDDSRPEFKFIGNMHGDEIMGRELSLLLIEDLASNYGKDPFITELVDKTQIYILPSMNPDGAESIQRGNANNVDLNRDFPDFSTQDNKNTIEGRAPETQAVMKWQNSRKFVLSANFHGGAEVVNYPWDTIPDKFPLFDLVKGMSVEYAVNAPYIGVSKEFPQGVTNGYEWYEVNGGMQDWSWYWYHDLQLTIELTNQKYPSTSTIPYYYQQNRKAMLTFIARTHTINQSRLIKRR